MGRREEWDPTPVKVAIGKVLSSFLSLSSLSDAGLKGEVGRDKGVSSRLVVFDYRFGQQQKKS
jgi:hypothetical protein